MMDKASKVERLKPSGGWSLVAITTAYTAWQKGKFCALSSVVNVYDEHLPPHDEWLISFSVMGQQRCSNQQVQELLKDFGAVDFEEDNHERGVARKFWKAVDPQYRVPCPCKDERVINEGDYSYSEKVY